MTTTKKNRNTVYRINKITGVIHKHYLTGSMLAHHGWFNYRWLAEGRKINLEVDTTEETALKIALEDGIVQKNKKRRINKKE